MLGQIKSRIRSLERKFANTLAEVVAEELVDEYVTDCYRAKDKGNPMPDPFDFCMEVAKTAGYFLRSTSIALPYLEKCQLEGKMPDELHLVRKLLPRPI